MSEQQKNPAEILYGESPQTESTNAPKDSQGRRLDTNPQLAEDQKKIDKLYGQSGKDQVEPSSYIEEVARLNREARAEAGDSQPDSRDQQPSAGQSSDRSTDRPDDGTEAVPESLDAIEREFERLAEGAGIDESGRERLAELHGQAQRVAWEQQTAAWEQQARQDAYLNDGDFEANIKAAQELVQRHGDRELVELLEAGLGNHPALARFLVKVARQGGRR